jgi:iron(III) transport system substrate-binding protein
MPTRAERLKDRFIELRARLRNEARFQRVVVTTSAALLLAAFVTLAVLTFNQSRRSAAAPPPRNEVVLYSSVDAPILREVVSAFEASSGVKVKVVTDTEATKTFGLVQRLIDEKDSPRADVWWGSEPMGSVRLAAEGVLEPFTSRAEADLAGGWPRHLRARDLSWYGHALRARVIAFNSNLYTRASAPRTLRELADRRYAGRVGMARPQFGSTRTHLAALVAAHGPEPVRQWLIAMRDMGVRLYDGNAGVVRAIAQGEIDLGLTDTDDVWAAQREGWPVDLVFEAEDAPNARITGPVSLPSIGPLVLPCTVGKVRGGRNPVLAKALIDYLLSAEVEQLMARGDWRTYPLRAELAMESEKWWIPPTRGSPPEPSIPTGPARLTREGVPGSPGREGVPPGALAPGAAPNRWPEFWAVAAAAQAASRLADEVFGPWAPVR